MLGKALGGHAGGGGGGGGGWGGPAVGGGGHSLYTSAPEGEGAGQMAPFDAGHAYAGGGYVGGVGGVYGGGALGGGGGSPLAHMPLAAQAQQAQRVRRRRLNPSVNQLLRLSMLYYGGLTRGDA